MTNEEARAIMTALKQSYINFRTKSDLRKKRVKENIQAYDMAIKALEQKPCEDIAQERYKDLCEYFCNAKDILKSREDFKAWLGRVKWHIRKAEELYEKYEYKQEPKTGQYEKHIDHTDCIWYGSDSGCPVTCSQYRDGWNDAMDYIYKGGKGYQPYRRE